MISRDIRLLEPAIGAAAAVASTWLYIAFTPSALIVFSPERIAVGAAIGFDLGLAGADAGERIAGRMGNKLSRDCSER